MNAGDAIFALASGAGRAGVAVLRVSGVSAGELFLALSGAPPPAARRVALRTLTDPVDGTVLDHALVLWFPAPASFTGEDVAELHIHGGPAVLEGVLAALGSLAGFRPAERGEFSRRAFRNGKMDLAEVEGLADLVEADTPAARGQAVWQMRGGLSAIYQAWRQNLTRLLALSEATLDFSDEPIPETLETEITAGILELSAELTRHLGQSSIHERLRDGFRVVLSGPPNVGKSSILNALAGREAAIVTALPGTTRDVLEVKLNLGGFPVSVYDTAGLRTTADPIEEEGVRRARAAAANADLVVDVRDARDVVPLNSGLNAVQRSAATRGRLVFWNKRDLAGDSPPDCGGLVGAATTGEGIPALVSALTDAAGAAINGAASPAITRARHRVAVADAVAALVRAADAPAPELRAEDLRIALRALGRVVGVVDVEEVLDHIFRAFCIGK